MIDHPFLNFKDLSDDELLDKTSELHSRLGKAHMWGSSMDIIHQLEWMLEMIEEEKMERMKKANYDALQAMFPEIVESDPEFKKDKVDVEPKESTKPTKKTVDLPKPVFHKEYIGKDNKSK